MLQRALRRFGRRAGVVEEPEPGGLAPSGELPIAIRRRPGRPPADLGNELIIPSRQKNGAAFNRGKRKRQRQAPMFPNLGLGKKEQEVTGHDLDHLPFLSQS